MFESEENPANSFFLKVKQAKLTSISCSFRFRSAKVGEEKLKRKNWELNIWRKENSVPAKNRNLTFQVVPAI